MKKLISGVVLGLVVGAGATYLPLKAKFNIDLEKATDKVELTYETRFKTEIETLKKDYSQLADERIKDEYEYIIKRLENRRMVKLTDVDASDRMNAAIMDLSNIKKNTDTYSAMLKNKEFDNATICYGIAKKAKMHDKANEFYKKVLDEIADTSLINYSLYVSASATYWRSVIGISDWDLAEEVMKQQNIDCK